MAFRLGQGAFSGGEVSEEAYPRVDLDVYPRLLKTAYNVVIHKQGGLTGRAGTKHICEVPDSSYAHRITPFEFNTTQTYVNVWGNLKMRVIYDDGEALEASKNVGSISQASQGVVGITSHGWSNGDKVYASGIGGMTALNGRAFIISDQTTHTFKLKDLYGSYINTSGLPAYTSGGVFARVHTVVSPYSSHADLNNAAAEVFNFDYAQSNDVEFIAHLSHAPQQLTRSGHAAWTIGAQSIGTTLAAPGSIAATATTGSGAVTYTYTVTAVNDATGEESVAGTSDNCTNDLSANPTYKNTITWASVASATRYLVYKDANGLMGFIGGTTGLSFVDGVPAELTPDLAFTPPSNDNPFGSSNNYPASVEFHEARLGYAQTNNQPGGFWLSQPTRYSNFNRSTPQRADDTVSGRLLPGVNAVQGMVSLGPVLAMFTSNGEQTVSGSGITESVTPASLRSQRWSRNGSDRLKPLMVGPYALYVQAQGRQIHAFGVRRESPSRYESEDLTTLAPHLFEGHYIVDWCYQQDPHSIVWIVRDDGVLVALTFRPDSEIFAFARCGIAGAEVESVCCISGPDEDEVYFATKRTINSVTKRHVEKLMSLSWGTDVADFWGLDDALLYEGSGTNTIPNLHHLEGQEVAALADGFLVTGLTVTAGAVTLSASDFPSGASKVLVGLLPDAPEFEPLPLIQVDKRGVLAGSRKRVVGLTMKLKRACGVYAGSNEATLRPLKMRKASVVGPTPPFSGDLDVTFDPKYTADGTFLVRGTAGLPMTVLGLYPVFDVSDANVRLTDTA